MRLTLLILAVGLLAYSITRYDFSCGPEIKPGQVWVWEYQTPFEFNVDTMTVLAVKDGYVQYRNSWGFVHDQSERFFRHGSRMIKP